MLLRESKVIIFQPQLVAWAVLYIKLLHIIRLRLTDSPFFNSLMKSGVVGWGDGAG